MSSGEEQEPNVDEETTEKQICTFKSLVIRF